MAKRTAPTVTPDTAIGGDVDIQREIRKDKQGRRVTDSYADRLIVASRKPGRPALADDSPSPSIAFRVPAALRAQAQEIAEREGKTISQLAREALEARVATS